MIGTLLTPSRAVASGTPRGRLPIAFGPTALRLLLVGFLLVIPAWIDRRAILALAAAGTACGPGSHAAVDLRRLPAPRALSRSRASGRGPLVVGVRADGARLRRRATTGGRRDPGPR